MQIPKLGGYMGGDGSLRDKLTMLSLAFNSDPEIRAKIPELMMAQRKKAEGDAFATDMANFVSGKRIPQRPQAAPVYQPPGELPGGDAPAPEDAGGLDLSAVAQRRPISVQAPQIPMRDQSADAFGGPVSVRGALPILARGLAHGQDPTKWRELLQAAEPKATVVNNRLVDERDPAALNKYYGDAPTKGAEPVYDANHREIGWRMSDGSIQAIAQAEEAGALGKTRGGIINVPMRDGTETPMTGAQYLDTIGGRGGVPKPEGFGVKPSAAQTKADTVKAEAGANADVTLPQTLADSESALGLIRSIRGHSALRSRTGWGGVLPALPDTPGVEFDSMVDQLKGRVFLDAFQKLKGGGAITEIEGKKAESAIARLNRKQSAEDFEAALDDLAGVISAGMERARSQPGRLAAPGGGAQPASRPRYTAAQIEAAMRARGMKVP